MFALAGTMLLMALYNLNAGGVTVPNVLVGMLTFSGGMAMTLVAMWEIARGNTLFATCKWGCLQSSIMLIIRNSFHRLPHIQHLLALVRRRSHPKLRSIPSLCCGTGADTSGASYLSLRLVYHLNVFDVSQLLPRLEGLHHCSYSDPNPACLVGRRLIQP